MSVESFGRGWLVRPERLPAAAIERAKTLAAAALHVRALDPAADIVVGGSSLLVLGARPDAVELGHDVRLEPAVAREHLIEVVYDGPDLATVAMASRCSIEEVIEIHASTTYVALLTGFMPGFAYLGEVDARIARPRLESPRSRVHAGAVGIAGSLTGVYPFASPGGWNLLGRAEDPQLFRADRDPPQRIAPLDHVRFVPVDRPVARRAPAVEQAEGPRAPGLRVDAVGSIATVQDRGRFHLRHAGLPWSGPLDPDTHDAANAAVGNDASAATIEVAMGSLGLVAEKDCSFSVDGAPEQRARAGERIVVAGSPDRTTSYLAVRGGIDVPEVLGSRSTLLVAGLGGHHGRALRKGDGLPIGAGPTGTAAPAGPRGTPTPAVAGIHPTSSDTRLGASALDVLLSSAFTISSKRDRIGVRLAGPTIPRGAPDTALPDPVLPGAVQVTTDGTPIVLGPDAAVTGGYPVIGVLSAESRALLGRLPPGTELRFRLDS